jgi:hypothetical protein
MTTLPTMTLADFLLARIDEDETRYRDTAGDEQHQDWALNKAGDYNEAYIVEEALRRLVECEAKRKIVEEYVRCLGVYRRTGAGGEWASAYLVVLQLLAVPYADHPDYREAW